MNPGDPLADLIIARIDAILAQAQEARTYVEASDMESAAARLSDVCVDAGKLSTTIRTIGV